MCSWCLLIDYSEAAKFCLFLKTQDQSVLLKLSNPHLYNQHIIYLSVGERTAGQARQVVRHKILKVEWPEQGSDMRDQPGKGGSPENREVAHESQELFLIWIYYYALFLFYFIF